MSDNHEKAVDFLEKQAEAQSWADEELVEILVDWHKYAHGIGKIGYCNNDKCQAALDEIKARILKKPFQPITEHK